MDKIFKVLGALIEIISPFIVGYTIFINKSLGLIGNIIGVTIFILYGIYLLVYKFKE